MENNQTNELNVQEQNEAKLYSQTEGFSAGILKDLLKARNWTENSDYKMSRVVSNVKRIIDASIRKLTEQVKEEATTAALNTPVPTADTSVDTSADKGADNGTADVEPETAEA